jgi:poly [ADP-ribose] polymerase 1
MVSKSANYCKQTGNVALLALSEVALGRIATGVHNLPPGYDSVKGGGQTEPNPQYVHTREDGVIIPFGAPTKVGVNMGAGLAFNEFIVYNEAQVNLQYLVKMKFA